MFCHLRWWLFIVFYIVTFFFYNGTLHNKSQALARSKEYTLKKEKKDFCNVSLNPTQITKLVKSWKLLVQIWSGMWTFSEASSAFSEITTFYTPYLQPLGLLWNIEPRSSVPTLNKHPNGWTILVTKFSKRLQNARGESRWPSINRRAFD